MSIIQTESTLTDRYQTTVPEPVRKALALGKRDRIVYRQLATGEVVIAKADEVADALDPAAIAFLKFLGEQIERHPSSLTPLTKERFAYLQALTAGVEFDIDKALDPEND